MFQKYATLITSVMITITVTAILVTSAEIDNWRVIPVSLLVFAASYGFLREAKKSKR